MFEPQGEHIDIGYQRADPALVLAVERDAGEECGFRLRKVAVGGVEQTVGDPVVGILCQRGPRFADRQQAPCRVGYHGLIAFLHPSLQPAHRRIGMRLRPAGQTVLEEIVDP